MKNLKTKKINSNIIGIIDIGTYKIKVAICNFGKEQIELLGFAEKRQSNLDIQNQEIKNLEGICENISLAIKKAQDNAKQKIDSFVINPFLSQTFTYSKTINLKRENKDKFINEIELEKLIKQAQEIHYKSSIEHIKSNFLYSKNDLEIILSNISEIKIDGKKVDNLIQNTGEKISFNLLNIFITQNNLELLNYFSKYLKKELLKILPEEFCLSKIWERKKEVVIIDIGNSRTFITVKDSKGNIIGSLKIGVGIENLINKIQENSDFSRVEIIKKINREDFFYDQKKEFLDIFIFLIGEALGEIMQDNPTPNNFFILGGGGTNKFIKDAIEKYDFSKQITIDKKIKFVMPNIKKLAKIKNVEDILNKSNLNLISMILAYNDILKHKQDIIEKILKKSVIEITKK